jgi:hypothetical protein
MLIMIPMKILMMILMNQMTVMNPMMIRVSNAENVDIGPIMLVSLNWFAEVAR